MSVRFIGTESIEQKITQTRYQHFISPYILSIYDENG